jgi:phosphate transport system substrate-binding protein
MSKLTKTRRQFGLLASGAVAILAIGVSSPAFAATQITGAGSTFDYPLFSKIFYEYSQQNPDITVNYQSIGSGGGIEQFSAQTVDFGATDVPMNAKELATAGFPVVQIPVALGGEGIGYNIPGIDKGLKLSGQAVADIYLGNVTSWNDPEIAKLNPNLKLPNLPITVVHRSDGSGTTYIFTDYLSTVSSTWETKVGRGKAVSWPAPSSVGGKGNEGVAGLVQQTPGSIGYIELAYLLANSIAYAQLQNSSGNFLYPSLDTVAAAAATKTDVSATNFSIVNATGANSYPISGYSWGLLAVTPRDPSRGAIVKKLFSWAVTTGQAEAATIGYVPLPANIQALAQKEIATIKTN